MLSSYYLFMIIWIASFMGMHCSPRSLIKPISVFSPDDSNYHKYSAVLAATERAKAQCALEIRRSLTPLGYIYHGIIGTDLDYPSARARSRNKVFDAACSRFENKVEAIVSGVGMPVNVFNDITEEVNKNPHLKQKVMEQAFSFRLAADLDNVINTRAKLPPHISIAPSRIPYYDSLKAMISRFSSSSWNPMASIRELSLPVPVSETDSEFTSFCKAVYNVEELRERTLSKLKNKLGVGKLPDDITAPEMLPTLCRPLYNAVVQFPRQAELVVAMHGLDADRFHGLLRKTKNNPFFRWRVNREICELRQLIDMDFLY